jgi:DNA helicase IV
MKDERNNFLEELSGIDNEIVSLKKKQAIAEENIYSEQVINSIQEYAEELEKYKLLTMFDCVFARATSEFSSLNKIKPNKTVRRYTLYAQLLFAMKFFGTTHEDSKLLCIDEGQDLALNEFRLIRKLNGEDVVFNIFGDTNQLLKPNRGISDWEVLKEFLDAKVFSLNENYRNTNQITKFCNMSFGMDVLQTGVDGSKVHEISRKELESKLCEVDCSTERIAVLIPRKAVRRTFEQEKKNEKDASGRQGYIQYDLLPDDIAEKLDDSLENNKISFMYVDEVKGIEFDKVFVVPNGMTENEKYIAYTRALSELILVIDDKITFPCKAKAVKMPHR